ncbi:hypothetical protein [Bacillus piscicola]|uniref:hypothetical protein n=1 Tax=Bacillus piscicola TaxID=1632684 RepID=UPI001F094542|nr:hypothetical protein [Bacillus piscicola]
MIELFRKQEEVFTFYDGEGKKVDRKTEIRQDPLTGETSRLVFDPGVEFTIPDYSETAKKTAGKNCPFCPENIEKMTPVFPDSISRTGRIRHGDAVVFPNLFPYSKHNGVVVFSGVHYVRLDDFTPEIIKNAFMCAHTYIRRVQKEEDTPLYTSINWNYLPHSGGSILHPHLHVILSEAPTNTQSLTEKRGEEFKRSYQKDYLTALYEAERHQGERFIGERGDVAWIHAFAPKSHHDYMAIFRGKRGLEEIQERDWLHFAEGLQRIFASLTAQGLASFNMVLTVPEKSSALPVHARLIPRLAIGGLATSDINFFQALHQEPLSYKSPEKNAEQARQNFSKRF